MVKEFVRIQSDLSEWDREKETPNGDKYFALARFWNKLSKQNDPFRPTGTNGQWIV